MEYTLGSLFDGSGGFPLAGSLCGIRPVWASEVEPYPVAVTRSRFPGMKHLDSVTDIHGGKVEPVDIITFGSPCQDLSVAGKRAGIRHEVNGDEETTRSGLFMEAVRIIKEMREATGGEYPSFALWENVPGAFSSSKGEDFRVVLEELIGIVEPGAAMPPVPKAGWAYADSYTGNGWSLAYRVFDAQHWGVPQRRRRIHLVLDLRGQRAREVLFEREGVRGYFAQSGAQGEGAAEDAQGSPASDDRARESASSPCSKNPHTERGGDPARHTDGEVGYPRAHGNASSAGTGAGKEEDLGGREPAEGRRASGGTGGRGLKAVIPFAANQRDEVRELGDKAGSIQAQPGMKQQTFIAYSFDALASNGAGGQVAACLYAAYGTKWNGNGGAFNGENFVLEAVPYAFHLQQDPIGGEVSPCIGGQHQATVGVAFQPVPGILLDDQDGAQINVRTDGKSPTLRAETHGNLPCVVEAAGFKAGQSSGTEPTVCVKTFDGLALFPVTEVCELIPIHDQATRFAGKRGEKTDGKGNGLGVGLAGDPMNTLTAADRHAVAYLASGKETVGTLMANAGTKLWFGNQEAFSGDYHIVEEKIQATYAKQAIGEYKQSDIASSQTARQYKEPTDLISTQYIVRRLTPTECARLQGFPDAWGHPDKLDSLTPEEYRFWLDVRNTHAAINGKPVKDYTEDQMLKWYNGLHTDSAEYKMWGNGIALPPALYCLQGIAEALEWEEMMIG